MPSAGGVYNKLFIACIRISGLKNLSILPMLFKLPSWITNLTRTCGSQQYRPSFVLVPTQICASADPDLFLVPTQICAGADPDLYWCRPRYYVLVPTQICADADPNLCWCRLKVQSETCAKPDFESHPYPYRFWFVGARADPGFKWHSRVHL